MTKKDFEAIAAAIANSSDMRALRLNVAAYCAQTNPRFDAARFLAACEPTLAPKLKYDTKVKAASIINGREHYQDQIGYVSAPSPSDNTHVMVFWPLLALSSVWAIADLVVVSNDCTNSAPKRGYK